MVPLFRMHDWLIGCHLEEFFQNIIGWMVLVSLMGVALLGHTHAHMNNLPLFLYANLFPIQQSRGTSKTLLGQITYL